MTIEDARKIILSHSDIGTECKTMPLLKTLRPYGGLREDSFLELLAAVVAVSPRLRSDPLDRELVEALWSLCSLCTSWGVAEDGMLRRNGLIKDSDWRLLQEWVHVIEVTALRIVGRRHDKGADLVRVADYIARREIRDYRDIFLPSFIEGLKTEDPDVRETIASAIGVYGAEAVGAVDALRAAMYQPVSETDGSALASVQKQIRETLAKIGAADSD